MPRNESSLINRHCMFSIELQLDTGATIQVYCELEPRHDGNIHISRSLAETRWSSEESISQIDQSIVDARSELSERLRDPHDVHRIESLLLLVRRSAYLRGLNDVLNTGALIRVG